jgi:hypothetical protein
LPAKNASKKYWYTFLYWQSVYRTDAALLTMKVYCVGGHITPFVGKGSTNFKKGSKGLKEYMVSTLAVLLN